MKSFRKLVLLLKSEGVNYRRFFVVYLILALAAGAAHVLTTMTTGGISDAALAESPSGLWRYLLFMAAFTAVNILVSALSERLSGRTSGRVEYALRGRYARSMTKMPLKDLSARSKGDILSIFSNDMAAAVRLMSEGFLSLFAEIAAALAAAVFLFILHPLSAVIFFALFPLLIWMQTRIARPIAPLMETSSRKRGVFNDTVSDCLQNTSLVLGYGLEDEMEARYLAEYDEYYASERKRVAVFTRLVISGIVAGYIPIIVLCISGAIATIQGRISIGEFVVLTTLGENVNSVLLMLSQRLNMISANSACAERVMETSEVPAEVMSGSPAAASEDSCGDFIAAKNLCFSYDGGVNVLNNVSLTVRKGEHIALVGPSGCGKSTLAKLFVGLYEPDGGGVEWFENAGITATAARDLVAYVPQDCFIFPDTIAENIACSAERNAAALADAASNAGILPFIKSLTGGFEYELSDSGDNLSGGQKQRIAIARALYKNAPVLVLDEATSALDAPTEQALLLELERSMGGRAIVTVAHRLAAVKSCDRIYYMENGAVLETGRYDELMRPGTRFFALYERQLKEEQQYAR